MKTEKDPWQPDNYGKELQKKTAHANLYLMNTNSSLLMLRVRSFNFL